MDRLLSHIYLIIAFILLSFFSYGQDSDWQFKKENDGIKIFTRPIDDSSLKELKIEASLKASLSSIMKILWAVPDYPEWVPHCKEAHVLQHVDELSVYYYVSSSFPWPLQNRDLVALSSFKQDKNSLEIVVKTISAHDLYNYEGVKGNVRIKNLEATWILTPQLNGIIDLTYLLVTDPGGNIPNWMTNKYIDKGPVQTIKKLQELAGTEKFRNSTMAAVKELESVTK